MKIAVDLEGVLADSNEVFSRVVAERYGVEAPASFQYQWNLIEAAKHALGIEITPEAHEELWAETWRLWKDIPVIRGVDGFYSEMKRRGHSVTILTHSFSKEIESCKKEWILSNVGLVQVEWVNGSKQKWEYDFDLFIDDSPHNVVELKRRGKKVLLFIQPWNAGLRERGVWFTERIHHLSDVKYLMAGGQIK